MDKLLETQQLPKVNHKERENLNRVITNNEIDSVIKNTQQAKVQNQAASQVNSTEH